MIEYVIAILLIANISLTILLIRSKDGNALNRYANNLENIEKNQERLEKIFFEQLKENRNEVANNLNNMSNNLWSRFNEMMSMQENKFSNFTSSLDNLTKNNFELMEKMRQTVEVKLSQIQEDNNNKLEKMRETVDEKLQNTLEKRLGESFKLVSERLEMVHKGLGEVQSLASDVGDLKKVLSNVKMRGTLGEIQLGNLIEQILTSDQYEKNVKVKKGADCIVEYAIKIPVKEADKDFIWLPIDAKFPLEVYKRLLDAFDSGDSNIIDLSLKELERTIKENAKNIKDKYIDPPNTTDFAIMFLPIEGLYAEVLRRSNLFETIQREFRVIMTGPTTLGAVLNSFAFGFRTLAIQKRTGEVMTLLSAIKTDFTKFGDALNKVKKKLDEAQNSIDDATKKSKQIEKRLKGLETLPQEEAEKILNVAEDE